jgi:hypothetical protein
MSIFHDLQSWEITEALFIITEMTEPQTEELCRRLGLSTDIYEKLEKALIGYDTSVCYPEARWYSTWKAAQKILNDHVINPPEATDKGNPT